MIQLVFIQALLAANGHIYGGDNNDTVYGWENNDFCMVVKATT